MFKTRILAALFVFVAAVVAGARTSPAQEFDISTMGQETGVSTEMPCCEVVLPYDIIENGGESLPCSCDSDYCRCRSGWTAMVESTLFQYDRADGSRVGDGAGGQPDEIFDGDYFLSPRISVGYQRCDGLGIRGRWWNYDHETLNPHPQPAPGPRNNAIAVDTYTIDLEVFDTFDCCNWTFDLSAGVRYNEFEEQLINTGGGGPDGFEIRRNAFRGWGGILAMEGVRSLNCYNDLYGRCRGAMLVDDKTVFNLNNDVVTNDETLSNTTQGMVEFAAGYQYTRCYRTCAVSLRAGVEWQLWYNYSSEFAVVDNENDFGGASDVSFFGYTLGGVVNF